MASSKPSVGRIVHYVSYGTPGGEYPSVCRAAVVTACVTVPADRTGRSDDGDTVDLCVFNPEGLFFNKGVVYDEKSRGGTWHWPEREG
jgi:hypothetical protein